MMQRSVSDVTYERVKTFRERWCVDLFYDNVGS